MVTGGVNEYAGVVPRSRFNSRVFMYRTQDVQFSVAYGHVVLREKGDVSHVGGPDHVTALVDFY